MVVLIFGLIVFLVVCAAIVASWIAFERVTDAEREAMGLQAWFEQ